MTDKQLEKGKELSVVTVVKIGKHLAGRLLNGKEYNEFPKTDN